MKSQKIRNSTEGELMTAKEINKKCPNQIAKTSSK